MTFAGLREMGVFDVAMRMTVAVGTGEWLAALTDGALDVAVTELVTELEAQHTPCCSVTVRQTTDLTDAIDDPGVLVVCLPEPTRDLLRDLDEDRSRLRHTPGVLLVTSPAEWARVHDLAPSLASWVSQVARLDIDEGRIDDEQREGSIRALEESLHLSRSIVIEQAESGILAPDPRTARMLVLLDRGDLIRE